MSYEVTRSYQPGDTIYLFKRYELVSAIVQTVTKSGQLVAKAIDKTWANGEPLVVRFTIRGREWGEADNYGSHSFSIVAKSEQDRLARAKVISVRGQNWSNRLREFRDTLAIPGGGHAPHRAEALGKLEDTYRELLEEHKALLKLELEPEEIAS